MVNPTGRTAEGPPGGRAMASIAAGRPDRRGWLTIALVGILRALAMALADDVVDLALMTKGIRTADEARGRWPYILSRLRHALDQVRRLKPSRRRMPEADSALDWLARSIHDATVAEDQRLEALAVLAALKAMIGAAAYVTTNRR